MDRENYGSGEINHQIDLSSIDKTKEYTPAEYLKWCKSNPVFFTSTSTKNQITIDVFHEQAEYLASEIAVKENIPYANVLADYQSAWDFKIKISDPNKFLSESFEMSREFEVNEFGVANSFSHFCAYGLSNNVGIIDSSGDTLIASGFHHEQTFDFPQIIIINAAFIDNYSDSSISPIEIFVKFGHEIIKTKLPESLNYEPQIKL